MNYDLQSIENKKVGTVELNERVFDTEISSSAIYESIKNILANKRQGTADTLTRAEVNGSTKKPFKQKGTGRARAGSKKSPLWRGKGIIFGPHPRDYSYSIPKKVRNKGLFSVLTAFRKDNKLIILDDFKIEKFSTKEAVAIFEKITEAKKVIYIGSSGDRESYDIIKKSCSNIPWLRVVNSKSIEIKDLYYANEVVVSKSAIEEINKRYEGK